MAENENPQSVILACIHPGVFATDDAAPRYCSCCLSFVPLDML